MIAGFIFVGNVDIIRPVIGKLWAKVVGVYPEFWMLLFAAIATRVWQVRSQYGVVFDEFYFRRFAGNYLDGQFFFDIHPPLGKLIFAGVAQLFGISSNVLNAPNFEATIVRFIPAIAGALLVVVVYGIVLKLGMGRKVAAFAALCVLLDNALLVESRFILFDSMLLLFGFGSLLCYLFARHAAGIWRWWWLGVTAVCLGLTVSTKWTGLAMVALLALLWCFDNRHVLITQKKRLMGEAVLIGGIILTVYLSCFALHFALLQRSGGGDDAYMSRQFQSTLQGSEYYNERAAMPFINKFVELNIRMYTAQDSLDGVRDASMSGWYTWPLLLHPIAYWHAPASDGIQQVRIYLLGNPLVWWGSTALLVTACVLLALRRSVLTRHDRRVLGFLLAGYYVNFVPFMFIQRGMYLYHYLFALVLAIMIGSIVLGRIFTWQAAPQSFRQFASRRSMTVFCCVVTAIVAMFAFFAPISYGSPISQPAVDARQWLPDWRP